MTLHIVIGPPCAGKSTHVQQNRAEGDLVVDFDLIARALGASGHRPEDPFKSVAMSVREKAIELAIAGSDDFDSWVIHSTPTPEHLRRYAEAGAEVITLDPGIEACLERCRERRPPTWNDPINPRLVRAQRPKEPSDNCPRRARED